MLKALNSIRSALYRNLLLGIQNGTYHACFLGFSVYSRILAKTIERENIKYYSWILSCNFNVNVNKILRVIVKMAIGAFPLAKLGFVLVKQISKPIANGIANRARKSKLFRNYICIPVAQLFHWYDVKVRMRVLNLGKVSNVPKLDEKKAIETGSQVSTLFSL